ncbi:MAG: thioredoxin [Candidatus Blackburnbacteria bacterium]|nr:thioredoxin [Candidatus Blackburnbacteria bacterium]
MVVAEITDSEFDQKVTKSDKPVLVDFHAVWCGPCKMAGPILDELADEYKNKVEIVKVDVDKNPNSTQKLGVMSIPTTILFKDGAEVGRQVGFGGKQKFAELIQKA